MEKLRIIGDIHGQYEEYFDLTKECDYSLQIGDMGFNYTPLSSIDSKKHKFIGGNHDNYDYYYGSPNAASTESGNKDFGEILLGNKRLYFVRGAFSIDWAQRQKTYLAKSHKTWWENEELDLEEMRAAYEDYKEKKPEIMITHDCPRLISKIIGDKKILKQFGYNSNFTTRTSELLQEMLEVHRPRLWVFGHYHKSFIKKIKTTTFICVPALDFIDI